MPKTTEQPVKWTSDAEHLDSVLRHIANVREACNLIGRKIINTGDEQFGRQLIQNGLIHDVSKLSGIEWKYLRKTGDPKLIQEAHYNHVMVNKHHPECWGNIGNVPPLYLAEMVADWWARSAEAGTNLNEWFKYTACDKFQIKVNSNPYKNIRGFIDLVLDEPMKKLS